jgi:hypothetical protein
VTTKEQRAAEIREALGISGLNDAENDEDLYSFQTVIPDI